MACSHWTNTKINTMSSPILSTGMWITKLTPKYDEHHTNLFHIQIRFRMIWMNLTLDYNEVFIAFTFRSFCQTRVYFNMKVSRQDFQGSCTSRVSHSTGFPLFLSHEIPWFFPDSLRIFPDLFLSFHQDILVKKHINSFLMWPLLTIG